MDKYLNKSFQVVFIMLISITLLTSLRSLQDNISNKTRLSLQLSSFVTITASMHYFLMIYDKSNTVSYRYFDWFFTTPVLLIDLLLILDIYEKELIIEILIYNTLMLVFGYLGELNKISKMNSTILGFIPFIIIFYKINEKLNEKYKNSNIKNDLNEKQTILNVFFILWTIYGLNHLNPNINSKNFIYNVMDLITKGLFGLYIYKLSWNE